MNGQASRIAGRSHRGWVLFATTLANAMILVDQTAVPMALPKIMIDFAVEPSRAQWVLTANVIPLAAGLVLGGRLGDLWGRRRVFSMGTLIFIAASATAGAAPTSMDWGFDFLVLARAVQGIGAAMMLPATIAIISAVFPQEERGRALGTMGGVAAVFAALGPTIGGGLALVDWRLVFFVNVPLALIMLAITSRTVPRLEPDPDSDRRIDWIGSLTLAVALGAFVLAFTQAQDWGVLSTGTLSMLAVSGGALVAFVVTERRVAAPLVAWGLFRHRNYLAATISQTLGGYAELGFGVIFPLLLMLNLAMSPAIAGLALLPATLPMILVAPLAGRWYDRVGGRVPLATGFTILAVAFLWIGLVVTEQSYWWLVLGLLLQGVGLSIVLTVNDPTAIDPIPPRDHGQAAGVSDTAEQVGGALGLATLATLFHSAFIARYEASTAFGQATQSTREKFYVQIQASEATGLDITQFEPAEQALAFAARDATAFGYRISFIAVGIIAAIGAVIMWALVRKVGSQQELIGSESKPQGLAGRFQIAGAGTVAATRPTSPPTDPSPTDRHERPSTGVAEPPDARGY